MNKHFSKIQTVLIVLILIGTLLPVVAACYFLYLTPLQEKESMTKNLPRLRVEPEYYEAGKRKGWHKIKLGAFEIEMPSDYQYYSLRGIDSYVGEITVPGSERSYFFDYGWYSNSLDDYYRKEDYTVSLDTLKGKFARVVLPKHKNKGAGIFVRKIRGDNSLLFFGKGLSNKDAIYAFKSISFRVDGVTSSNFGKNLGNRNHQDSEYIFEANCVSCHSREMGGVSYYSLRDLAEQDTIKLREFMLKTKKLSYYTTDDLDHDFTFLTDNQLRLLIDYIKSY